MKKPLKVLVFAFILIALFLVINHFHEKRAYISITFDDGYVSQYGAAKTLESYGWRGTFYVPSVWLGETFEDLSLMNLQQIKELQSRGHEIGGHTLSQVHANNVSDKVYEFEVTAGKNILEKHGIKISNFAFPYGDDSKKDIALRYYDTVRTTESCVNKFSSREICGLTLFDRLYEYAMLPYFIEDLKQNGGWLVVVIHKVDENPRPAIDLTQDEYIWVLNQIKNSGVSVKTVAEVVDNCKYGFC